MRAALWLVGLFAAAVALALLAGANAGTVTVFWPPHRVDLSLNLVLLLLAGLFTLVHLALRGVTAMMELPRQARRWRAQQRERAAHALLLDAQTQYAAGRYLRARKAATGALARAPALAEADDVPTHLGQLRALAHLTAAEGAHALQDQPRRDEHLEQALAAAAAPGVPPELREGLLLRAARWALHEQDAAAALARLHELPAGALRRTAALRIQLKAARQSGRIEEALETARQLAKHRAFSADAARSLIRGLAAERIRGAEDADALAAVWAQLLAAEREAPELALRAAQRLLVLQGDAALAREWLLPVWEQYEALSALQRVRLIRVLEAGMAASGPASQPQWLARIEAAQQARPGDANLQYLAGMACVHRGLWGKAQVLLTQAAGGLHDAELRRNAWRALGALAERRGDAAEAAQAWQRAAGA